MNVKLDQYDFRILELLQQDARISHAEVGRRVHLSQPASQTAPPKRCPRSAAGHARSRNRIRRALASQRQALRFLRA
jgi:hypothetical protein